MWLIPNYENLNKIDWTRNCYLARCMISPPFVPRSYVHNFPIIQTSVFQYFLGISCISIIRTWLQTMLVAGSETSATTMEWAMSLLLNHPEALKKAVAEIDTVVGIDRLLVEADLSKLNYLQNVIHEAFRLYPVLPLLLPHESSNDCKVCGFDVPQGTMLLVNLWTIHRDPKLWSEPTAFMPERFESGEIEGYKLIPFGAGRRACPGAALARQVIGLGLGALIQAFEWGRIGDEEIDLTEGTGLSMPKAEPLEALCKPRQAVINLLSAL